MIELQRLLRNRGYYNGDLDNDFGKMSKAACVAYLRAEFSRLNYAWTPNGIAGIRMTNRFTNKFVDFMVVIKNNEVVEAAPASTVPGNYYVYNPLTVGGITGAAVLIEGQYKDCWTFTTSKTWGNLWSGMPYFMQTGAVSIWRDANKNDLLDATIKTTGFYGINLHRGWLGNLVNNASAGCQVVPDSYWTRIIQHFAAGQKVTYTLLSV